MRYRELIYKIWVVLIFCFIWGCSDSSFNDELVVELKKNKPTHEWKAVANKGGWNYSSSVLQGTDDILDGYIVSLAQDKAINKTDNTLAYVETAVIALNGLSRNNGYFIETMEREQLADFIQSSAIRVGFSYQGDITERWREW